MFMCDSEESGGGGPPSDSLEIPDLVRYGDHQDSRDHHDPANLDKLGGNFLHHPAVMGSLEKLIRLVQFYWSLFFKTSKLVKFKSLTNTT
ncbi:hypothetical protein CRE_00351 [Caenorhabditis remanei]|uniref:Uncharacterized protein n=1 Tax=Caenorhabditis remanei TaxID=31234 RepID=E3LEN6_CAERE|nr:hypothetical protein CRE_00351 [Caenorhabditis remanei]